jgi:chloride channel protein, CIC family
VTPGATRLEALMEQLLGSTTGALIVEGPTGEYGVVLLEYVRELGREDELQSVLIAADVARRVPIVAPSAELPEVVRSFSAGSPDALLVVDPNESSPLGLVTRASLAEVLLEWYATQLKAGSERSTAPGG